MDRFIVMISMYFQFILCDLKSNMDRFIGYIARAKLVNCSMI